jgi:2-haloacid dehalogenase
VNWRRGATPPRSCRTAPLRCSPPRPQAYALVTDHLQLTPAQIIFVSSNRWDVMGAATFGFRTAWINRANMPEEYGPAPDAVLTDLRGLMSLAW